MLTLALLPMACGGGARRAAITWWVDGATGSDLNSGSAAQPFRTITHALSIVQIGENIDVRPGDYDASHGETFPLVIPVSVKLVGDTATAGMGLRNPPTRIVGAGEHGVTQGGTTAVEARAGVRIAGFSITNPVPGKGSWAAVGILIRSSNVEVDACTITDCSDGIRFGTHPTTSAAPSGCVVHRCNILDNDLGMVAELFYGTSVRVEQTRFEGNGRGATTDGASVDLGGGPLSSLGGNTFRCNDIHVFTNGQSIGDFEVAPYTLSARSNFWDPAPPPIVPLPAAALSPETGEIAYLLGVTVEVAPAFAAAACP